MSRIGLSKLFLILGGLVLACGCSGGPSAPSSSTAVPPTPTASVQAIDQDLTFVAASFLNNLPPDLGLIASQALAQQKTVIVDVRQPEEYKTGFIAGAINIPLRELTSKLQALPGMDQPIVVVCGSGHRSAIAMATLRMLGYKQVRSLTGGLAAWQAAKMPLVTQPVPSLSSGAAPPVNAQVLSALGTYLTKILPEDWGLITSSALVEDQAKQSNLEFEAQPDHYEQGPSILVDVDAPDEFAKQTLPKAINIPLGELVDYIDRIPQDNISLWA